MINIKNRIEFHTFSFVGKVRAHIFKGNNIYRFKVFRFEEITDKNYKSISKMLSNLLLPKN